MESLSVKPMSRRSDLGIGLIYDAVEGRHLLFDLWSSRSMLTFRIRRS